MNSNNISNDGSDKKIPQNTKNNYDPRTYNFKKGSQPPKEIIQLLADKYNIKDDVDNFTSLLCIKDVYYFGGIEQKGPDHRAPLVKIKQVTDYREKWRKVEIEKLQNSSEGSANWGDLSDLETKDCPLDAFDGIVFDAEDNKVICKIDDQPTMKWIDEDMLDKYVLEKHDTTVRQWIEGTVVIVFKYRGHTFFSTRSKLNFDKTIVNTSVPGCPFLEELWNEACERQNFDDKQLSQEGSVHVMLVVNKWNQIINQEKDVKPVIFHIKSYCYEETKYHNCNDCNKMTSDYYISEFADTILCLDCCESTQRTDKAFTKGNYLEEYKLIEDVKFENCENIPIITFEEGSDILKNEGVLVTAKPFKNQKIMFRKTYEKYVLRSEQNIEMVWYRLRDDKKEQQLVECLPPFIRNHLKIMIENIPEKEAEACSYFLNRYIRSLRNKEFEAASRTTGYFNNLLNSVRARYREAKDEFYSQIRNKGKKFYWGTTKAETTMKIFNAIESELNKLPGEYRFKTVRDARRLERQEELTAQNSEGGKIGSTYGSITITTQANKENAKKHMKEKRKQTEKRRKQRKYQNQKNFYKSDNNDNSKKNMTRDNTNRYKNNRHKNNRYKNNMKNTTPKKKVVENLKYKQVKITKSEISKKKTK